jgi:LCP family protein required for cell wall assembly
MSKPTPRHTRASRAFRRLSFLLAGLVSLAVATAAGGSIAYLRYLDDSIPKVRGLDPRNFDRKDEGPTSSLAGGVTNVVVVGSDSREVLSEEEQATKGDAAQIGGQRSDTLILVHLDPSRQQAVMVHFPRDLLVDIPGYGRDRINAAYNAGGANLVLRTVKRLSGLPIHHYVEVNFEGFQRLVDAVGGVRICTERPIVDEKAGLSLEQPGCRILGGVRALAFVRARNVAGDVIPDFARIARQQQFIRALLNKLLTVRSLLRPSLIREAAGNVSTDAELKTIDMIYLARELQKLAEEKGASAAAGVDFRVVPSTPQLIDDISYVVPIEDQMKELFERLETGRPLKKLGQVAAQTEPTPANIRILVYDAGGRAQEVRRRLLGGGFVVLALDPAPPDLRRSVILYSSQKLADVVSRRYPDVKLRQVSRSELGNADVIVVVGRKGFG